MRISDWSSDVCSSDLWPPNMADIMTVLMLRPIPHTRNWYTHEHDTALKYRIPHGQSVDELRAEKDEHGVPATEGGTGCWHGQHPCRQSRTRGSRQPS